MMPGFLHRVQTELQHLIREPRYKNVLAIKKFRFHTPPAKANYTAWLGGEVEDLFVSLCLDLCPQMD